MKNNKIPTLGFPQTGRLTSAEVCPVRRNLKST